MSYTFNKGEPLGNKLSVRWSKKQNDILYEAPVKADGWLMYHTFSSERIKPQIQGGLPVFEDSFLTELDKRGYDLKTLKFSIKLKNE